MCFQPTPINTQVSYVRVPTCFIHTVMLFILFFFILVCSFGVIMILVLQSTLNSLMSSSSAMKPIQSPLGSVCSASLVCLPDWLKCHQMSTALHIFGGKKRLLHIPSYQGLYDVKEQVAYVFNAMPNMFKIVCLNLDSLLCGISYNGLKKKIRFKRVI